LGWLVLAGVGPLFDTGLERVFQIDGAVVRAQQIDEGFVAIT
jgi:hypothetical protein